MKRMFWLLLLACMAFFAYMQWGGGAAGDGNNLQAQPEINADKIRLLRDVAPPVAQSAAESAVPVAATAAAQSAVAATPACMEWGEFAGDDLARATAALAAFKLGNTLSQRGVEHTIGYWVYLPPLKDKAEVDAKIAQIKALGVNDYFVIQDEGKWHNALSLGLFKTPEAAQKFLQSVAAKGVKSAKVGARAGKLTSTIFVLKEPDTAATAKLAALQKDFPDSELKAAACAQ
jgi:hypothetical protein